MRTADRELAHLRARAVEWIAGDPDPVTRERLQGAVDLGDRTELRAALDPALEFGTAGLRGQVGPGPARMNRATVIRTTRGLADHVLATVGADRPVVVGFDARPDSARFARDVVGVLVAAGLRVRRFADPVPTPLVAYAARVDEAAAAVVVTASHNPAEDNGYKVYGPDARQIVPPTDARIAAAADAAGAANQIPLGDPDDSSGAVTTYDERLASDYLAELSGARPAVTGPDRRIVYTPLHGVGGELALRALGEAGYADVHVVPSQFEPDGAFPTVAFPNPEEPGALDEALRLGDTTAADLVLANDPDADRLAMAVPGPDGAHRQLSGNQLGVVLGDHLLRHHPSPHRLVVSTVVSSPMLAAVAAAHGARYEPTLTGFKWICRAAAALAAAEGLDFVFGYEEALGYVVGDVVRDKDGIAAAVVAADLVRDLAAHGRTVSDRLEELYRRDGLWVSRQRTLSLDAVDGPQRVTAVLDALSRARGDAVGARDVLEVNDHRRGPASAPWRPPSPMVELALADGRALLRPSGTEPKVKVYVDLRADRSGDLATQERDLGRDADAVAEAVLARAAAV
jgi:phosphomannomutase